jgi:FKBP-type peptidyl-prolyl cis-trans isomerase FklB
MFCLALTSSFFYLRALNKLKPMYPKVFSILSILCLSALIACNGQKGKSKVELKSQADSVAYAIGTSIGSSMKKDGLDSLNLEILKMGLMTSMKGDSVLIDPMKSQMVIQNYLQEKQKVKGDANLAAGKKFLDENRTKPGVKELPDGLQYLVMKEGTGPIPTATDTVQVHYHGTLIDGTVFDSSVDKGQPIEWPVGKFIQGWTEALEMMKVGSKWKLFVPPSLGYGERGSGAKVPANATLIFEMELLGIKGK